MLRFYGPKDRVQAVLAKHGLTLQEFAQSLINLAEMGLIDPKAITGTAV